MGFNSGFKGLTSGSYIFVYPTKFAADKLCMF